MTKDIGTGRFKALQSKFVGFAEKIRGRTSIIYSSLEFHLCHLRAEGSRILSGLFKLGTWGARRKENEMDMEAQTAQREAVKVTYSGENTNKIFFLNISDGGLGQQGVDRSGCVEATV